jgi:hypothetical protein
VRFGARVVFTRRAIEAGSFLRWMLPGGLEIAEIVAEEGIITGHRNSGTKNYVFGDC